MAQMATVRFVDAEMGDEVAAVVRVNGEHVGLCLSLASNGDVEVFMKREAAQSLVESLQTALAAVSGS